MCWCRSVIFLCVSVVCVHGGMSYSYVRVIFCVGGLWNSYNGVSSSEQQNREFFKASPETETWKAYVDYVDEMVVEGFFNTIKCSLQFLLNNTDLKLSPDPLYEARLELQVLQA